MAPKRRARDYTGALAEQIYLHRHETVDQVMARTVRKIPLLFKHHKIDPSDESPVAAALREAKEEVGLAPMLVETTRTLQDPSGKSLYDAWKATAERESLAWRLEWRSATGLEQRPATGLEEHPATVLEQRQPVERQRRRVGDGRARDDLDPASRDRQPRPKQAV